MNNIQKNFKAKRGLCMAQGGLIDQLDPSGQMSRMDLGALTNDPTVLNAAMDREGLAAEQARQAKYPGQTFMNPVAQPQRQAAPQQAAQLQPQQPLDKFREPAPTSFEQDNNARGLRIQGYGDQLAGMRKERLGLADGTANVAQAAQPESAEQVMARMAAKYGVSAQPTAAPVQAPQPVQQAPQPAPQRQGLMGAAMGLIGGRAAQIDKAVNGYAEGGIVRGQGGPTDDEVPMQVAGKDVNLSNSEAVLPVKTVQALGGPEAVEHLIEETNGKPPVRGGLRAGGEYADGWSLGSGQKPTIYDNGGLPAQVVQAGVDTMRGQLATPVVQQGIDKMRSQLAQSQVSVDVPTDPDTDGRRTYSTPTAPAFINRGATAQPQKPTGLAAQTDYSNEGRAKPQPGINPISTVDRTLVDNTLGKDATIPQGLRNRWADNDPMKAQQYISADNAANGLRNNPTDGHGVVSIQQADGKFKNTLMSPSQYTGADGKPTSDWSKTAQFAQGTAQAQKDKESLRAMQRDRFTRDTQSDITDPNVVRAGRENLARMDHEDATVTQASQAKELMGLRRDQLGLQERQLGQQDTHFNKTLEVQKELAKVAKEERAANASAIASEKRIKDLDGLIEDQGVDDPKEFRDFMRNNFFGRKHMIEGKEVEVPGMEDMSSDQMRALMPAALMQYRFNKEFNAASASGTSKNAPKGLRRREANYSDVEKNSFGFPKFSKTNPNKLALHELWNGKLPDGMRQINTNMLEELDAKGVPIRKAREGLMAGQPDQSLDREAYIRSLIK